MDSQQDWWKGAVIYQIYPRSYQDSNGDGIGDIPGITQRLPHIASLGVDAIWLSPIFTSPMKDMGYDVSDYTDIAPVFGTLEDFDQMIARAHELGLKVMVDQVLSHSSDQHPFFQESRKSRDNPKTDWYVWADPKPDGSAPNNWQAIFGGIAWQWDASRRQYYLHNFLVEQPDFNFHNPEVQDWLLETMRFWLDRGVDGFRLDTVNFYFHDQLLRDEPANMALRNNPPWRPYDYQYHIYSKNRPENLPFLQRMRSLLDEYDERTLVGEVGDGNFPLELMCQYTTGNRIHMAYSFEMLSPKFTAGHFRGQIENFFREAPEGWPCWAFSNHDVVRHTSRWLTPGMNIDDLAKQAGALLLSMQGSICIYQGEELGQLETELEYEELTDPQGINFWPEDKGRDGCRTPMVWHQDDEHGGFTDTRPWLPVKLVQRSRAVNTQESVAGSVLEFYKQMLRLRKSSPALVSGATRFLDMDEPMLVFTRGEQIQCAFNLSDSEQSIELESGDILVANAVRQEGDRWIFGSNGFLLLLSKT